jgi:ATP-dependent protease ClpP protease subunit
MPASDETLLPRRRISLLADLEEKFPDPGVTTEDGNASLAKVFLYDEIGGWGVWPDDFQRTLAGITAPTIELHLHSPGGDAFDGIAIYHAFR